MTTRLPAQAFRGLEYIRRYYGVPAKRGGRVAYTDFEGVTHLGWITGASGAHVRVRFDGDNYSSIVHPTNLTYYEEARR